eukprot:355151-Chlamydomonas_euryale.AAC.6
MRAAAAAAAAAAQAPAWQPSLQRPSAAERPLSGRKTCAAATPGRQARFSRCWSLSRAQRRPHMPLTAGLRTAPESHWSCAPAGCPHTQPAVKSTPQSAVRSNPQSAAKSAPRSAVKSTPQATPGWQTAPHPAEEHPAEEREEGNASGTRSERGGGGGGGAGVVAFAAAVPALLAVTAAAVALLAVADALLVLLAMRAHAACGAPLRPTPRAPRPPTLTSTARALRHCAARHTDCRSVPGAARRAEARAAGPAAARPTARVCRMKRCGRWRGWSVLLSMVLGVRHDSPPGCRHPRRNKRCVQHSVGVHHLDKRAQRAAASRRRAASRWPAARRGSQRDAHLAEACVGKARCDRARLGVAADVRDVVHVGTVRSWVRAAQVQVRQPVALTVQPASDARHQV